MVGNLQRIDHFLHLQPLVEVALVAFDLAEQPAKLAAGLV
jgi:hypothetical protein